ncbi:hypothetical protein RUND412_007272 [Rhizina undulata]
MDKDKTHGGQPGFPLAQTFGWRQRTALANSQGRTGFKTVQSNDFPMDKSPGKGRYMIFLKLRAIAGFRKALYRRYFDIQPSPQNDDCLSTGRTGFQIVHPNDSFKGQSSGSDRQNRVTNSSFHAQSPPASPHAPASKQHVDGIAASVLSSDVAPPIPEILRAIAPVPPIPAPSNATLDVEFVSPDSVLVTPAIRRAIRKLLSCERVYVCKYEGRKRSYNALGSLNRHLVTKCYGEKRAMKGINTFLFHFIQKYFSSMQT